jgi:hypothetical protein
LKRYAERLGKREIVTTCEISSSHGGEYDVQSCLLGYTAVLPPSSGMMGAVRTSETSVDNHFTRQYNPEDSSEHSYNMSVGELEGMTFGRPRHRERVILERILKKQSVRVCIGFIWLMIPPVAALVNTVIYSQMPQTAGNYLTS